MFFAPPEVKAISRYSDFGSHLGVRSFGVMLLLAIVIHATLLGIYAMMPHNKIVKIPVRVLNINLGANIAETAPVSEQPLQEPSSPPPHVEVPAAVKATPEEPVAKPKAPQIELDKALASDKEKSERANAQKLAKEKAAADKRAATDKKIAAALAEKLADKKAAPTKRVMLKDTTKDLAKDTAIPAPKQYVRESPLDLTSPAAIANAKANTNAKPEEMVQRYEQDISLWVQQRKIYPEQAKASHAEGEVILRIRINRQGHILSKSIETSSGNAFLDSAALKMANAADPVPPVPKDYPVSDEEIGFLVPLYFTLEK